MHAIRFTNVSKDYRMQRQRSFLAKDTLARLFRRGAPDQRVHALVDVDFTIERGEVVGVIGQNGSGKSTLLALAARTSYPSRGTVSVVGRIGPLLELGAGFHPSLTGLENIELNASLLGLSRAEVAERLPAIVEYSGIGEFVHSSIQTYSTGMTARLGFAVLAHLDPDVLLVDEALSVGDAEFQSKCLATMQQFLARGTTVLMVSHDLGTVRSFCKRVLWMEHGRLRMDGPAGEVIDAYLGQIAH